MSNSHLPQEIVDHIIDFLCDRPKTLGQCCLVSRSWIQRARKHLFGAVGFNSSADLERWKETFPSPLNSPAYHTHFLDISCAKIIAAFSEECDWIRSFSNVVRLEIWSCMRLPFFTPLTASYDFQTSLPSFRTTVALTTLQAYLFPAPSRRPGDSKRRDRRSRRR